MLASNVRHTAHKLLDERPQPIVVGVRRVLLKAERRRDEVDAHPERFAQRQHDGRSCFRIGPNPAARRWTARANTAFLHQW